MVKLSGFELFLPVSVTGADARTFMQGQLTNDLRKVTLERAVLAALCSPQGRVQTMVSVIERAEGLVLLLDRALASDVLSRVQAFTLSSKVAFSPAPLVVASVSEATARELFGQLPESAGGCATSGELSLLRWWGAEPRYLLIAPRDAVQTVADDRERAELAWRRADVREGLPTVHEATRKSFVPQMLNLDVVSGLSYEKGCYVGQEVVARARRGGVPRRMFGFSSSCSPPPPGTQVTLADVDVGEVVDAVPSETGCELLAVVELDQRANSLCLRGVADSALSSRALPYDVPVERR